MSAGASVVITGRHRGDLERAQAELGSRAFAVVADGRNPAEVSAAVREAVNRFGGLDILVNNAGVAPLMNVADMSIADWRG